MSSSGGVLLDVLGLAPWWEAHSREWLAVPAVDTEHLLRGERVTWTGELRPGQPVALIRSLISAVAHLARRRPQVVVSAGTGVAVPVFLAAWLLRIPRLWVETANVVAQPGTVSRICCRLGSAAVVQDVSRLCLSAPAVHSGPLY